jgi:hypothetical protein
MNPEIGVSTSSKLVTTNKEQKTTNPSEIARTSHFTVYPVEYIFNQGVNKEQQTKNNLDQGTYSSLLQRNMKVMEMAKEPKPRNTLKILTRIFKALSLQKIYHHEMV